MHTSRYEYSRSNGFTSCRNTRAKIVSRYKYFCYEHSEHTFNFIHNQSHKVTHTLHVSSSLILFTCLFRSLLLLFGLVCFFRLLLLLDLALKLHKGRFFFHSFQNFQHTRKKPYYNILLYIDIYILLFGWLIIAFYVYY